MATLVLKKGSDNMPIGSIHKQMLLRMLALALIPLMLVSGLSYMEARRSLTHAAINKLEDTAAEKVQFIKNWFDYRVMDLQKQAEDRSNVLFLRSLRQGYLKSGLPLDQYVLSYDFALRETEGKQDLMGLILTYDYIYDLFLIDKDGNILFTILKEDDLGTNLKQGDYSDTLFAKSVMKTLNTGSSSFSDIERYSASNNVLTGFLSAPLLGEHGDVVGAVAIQVIFDRMFGYFDDVENKTDHYLVGSDGYLRSRFREGEEEILNREIMTEPYRTWRESNRVTTKPSGLGGSVQIENIKAANYQNPLDMKVIGLHQSIDILDVQWILISEMEERLALASANYLATVMLVLLIITFFIVLVFTRRFARRFSEPILALSTLSEKAAKGLTSERAEICENNELGVLAGSFNNMLEARSNYEKALKENNETIVSTLEKLEESSRQLELVIGSTGVGIWDWQVQTGEVVFNERWAEIIGYTLSELEPIGKGALDKYKHPEDLIQARVTREYHWSGKIDRYTFETRMMHKNGYWIWVLDTGKVVEWCENGKPKRMIGTHIDITERKQVEAQLMEAKEAAETAAQSKSEFLASMSHEIRTPMNGVLGMLGLLARSKLNEDQMHQTKLALSSAESLLSLINDILDFSKVEAGKLDLEILDFNLPSMLQDFSESMAHRVEEAGLEFVLDLTGVNQTMVKGDPSRIRQILTNLVSNAIKFTPNGEVAIIAETTTEEGDNLCFRCSVNDTGIGIDNEKLKHIFESFRQVDASTTRKFGGTGLGLSIVKRLCQLMDGDVSVTSSIGKGSRFSFEVPLKESNISSNAVPLVDIHDTNILVVDDNATNRDVMRRQLEQWGANVTLADSAQEALDLFDSYSDTSDGLPFSVAILDMQMPEMDGEMLAKEIHKRPLLKDLKLIMMTSFSSRGDAAHFANLGFSAYFRKPTTLSALHDALAVVIDGGSALKQAKPLVTQHYVRGLDNRMEEGANELTVRVVSALSSARFLLVEDNIVNQKVAKGLLEEMGLSCDVAADGKEAISSMETRPDSEPYDIILMDCQMPEMDGYKATRCIRAGAAGKRYIDIPIIALTANAMKGDKERCLAAGMSDYLPKPIDPDMLIGTLEKWSNLPIDKDAGETLPVKDENYDKTLQSWNTDAALKRVRFKPDRLKSLIAMFMDDMPERVRELSRLVVAASFEEVVVAAHACKGVAGNLGAEKLMALSAEIEESARNRDLEETSLRFERLSNEFSAVVQIMNEYIQRS